MRRFLMMILSLFVISSAFSLMPPSTAHAQDIISQTREYRDGLVCTHSLVVTSRGPAPGVGTFHNIRCNRAVERIEIRGVHERLTDGSGFIFRNNICRNTNECSVLINGPAIGPPDAFILGAFGFWWWSTGATLGRSDSDPFYYGFPPEIGVRVFCDVICRNR